ncbi:MULTISPECIES: PIN domain-containing protein [unclassified Nostoc]|uniref:PIN domain-containing protein n=1 Tax=unclassified Nostoc TaxID=2593658 RepID=UPI002AD46D1F|nr:MULTISPECIES: PIN domain-containing protein [unclassified Nostoc]MDZ8121981.1 PIN domain-containing protein [Nostoc sp. CmiVER01]MDZ8221484.1 PIN domain-containing protein [Nostoc sp. ChiVER01]
MIYLLDSNVCMRLINNSSPAVTTRLASQQPEDILVSRITQLELYYGAYRSAQQERNLEILQLAASTREAIAGKLFYI